MVLLREKGDLSPERVVPVDSDQSAVFGGAKIVPFSRHRKNKPEVEVRAPLLQNDRGVFCLWVRKSREKRSPDAD